MKRILIAAAVFALSAATAAASGDTEIDCNGNGSCDFDNSEDNSTKTENTNTNANINTATGGAGGKGGDGGNATIEKGAVKVDNTNLNLQGQVQSQKQKQQQSQQQQQTAKSKSSSNSSSWSESEVKNSGNSSVSWSNPRETSSAYSPGLIAAQETCVQSQSAGAQGPAFGISLGFTHDNEGCHMRRNAAMLFSLKREAAAIELMCSDDDVRAAMSAAGTPCAADRDEQPVATYQPVEPAAPKYSAVTMEPIKD